MKDIGPRLFTFLLSAVFLSVLCVLAVKGKLDPTVASVLGTFAAGLGIAVKALVAGDKSDPPSSGSATGDPAAPPASKTSGSSPLSFVAFPAAAAGSALLAGLLSTHDPGAALAALLSHF